MTKLVLLLCLAVLVAGSAYAQSMTGTRKIVLGNAAGERVQIGTVNFTDAGHQKTAFTVDIAPEFGEYFLAMRPFRCLSGPQQRLCWFPVNREAQVISATDLVPLEYALMFMRTKPASQHLNPFNGVYYKLAWAGDKLTGTLHDVDMDPFITPDSVPPERRVRPLRPSDLSVGDASTHWLPMMSIE
ncbi:hypothetical protein [Actimicrobium antarcticum]|uniref:DUF2330 domain-containing protein n=1 Tax=Actimicrobium antarcticum TaxID=1051899 RepID=A0ABP7TED5_9BURK